MTHSEAFAQIRSAIEEVVPNSGGKISMDTDLTGDGILDSLDTMNFLFRLEKKIDRKLDAVDEDYGDFRVKALVDLICK
jgi:acyl carrier protein